MRTLFAAAFALFGTSFASAQCRPDQAGTQACPVFTAPAATAIPNVPMAGSVGITPGLTTLFNGAVPPNGFMVQITYPNLPESTCWVSDNGPATPSLPPIGFMIGGFIPGTTNIFPILFVTPPGYKPMGPVSVFCTGEVLWKFEVGEGLGAVVRWRRSGFVFLVRHRARLRLS
jgi:hypothetical protein